MVNQDGFQKPIRFTLSCSIPISTLYHLTLPLQEVVCYGTLNPVEPGEPMATKIDYKVEFKSLYAPSATAFSVVEVPPMNFLMIDGAGNPNSAPE